MALSPSALTSVDRLRAWVTQGQTAETDGRYATTALEALIDRAGGAIESYCDRSLVAPATAQTYRLDGHGDRRAVLPDWPLISVTSVTVDGQPVPERRSWNEPGWLARPAEAWIELVGYVFSRGVGNVEIVARLGYDAALATTDRRHQRALEDLEQACLLLAGQWFGQLPAGQPLGESPARAAATWPAEVRGLLAPYRRLGG